MCWRPRRAWWRSAPPRIATRHTHGTGCTLASAIAAGLAQGMELRAAVGRAHAYVQAAIGSAPGFGGGHGPLNHAVTVDPARLAASAVTKPRNPAFAEDVAASFASQGALRTIGAVLDAVEPGRCVIRVPYSEAVTQHHGFFHGGVIGMVADVAGGYAAMTLCEAGLAGADGRIQDQLHRPGVRQRHRRHRACGAGGPRS